MLVEMEMTRIDSLLGEWCVSEVDAWEGCCLELFFFVENLQCFSKFPIILSWRFFLSSNFDPFCGCIRFEWKSAPQKNSNAHTSSFVIYYSRLSKYIRLDASNPHLCKMNRFNCLIWGKYDVETLENSSLAWSLRWIF